MSDSSAYLHCTVCKHIKASLYSVNEGTVGEFRLKGCNVLEQNRSGNTVSVGSLKPNPSTPNSVKEAVRKKKCKAEDINAIQQCL